MGNDPRLDHSNRSAIGAPASERRASPRHKIPGEVEIATEEPYVRIKGSVSDISLTGCKVHLDAELPLDCPVSMRFSLRGAEFEIRGTVRRKSSESGFGIQFLPAESSSAE